MVNDHAFLHADGRSVWYDESAPPQPLGTRTLLWRTLSSPLPDSTRQLVHLHAHGLQSMSDAIASHRLY